MIKNLLDNNKDLALVLGMILILIILFAPIPTAMLDLAIIINFGTWSNDSTAYILRFQTRRIFNIPVFTAHDYVVSIIA